MKQSAMEVAEIWYQRTHKLREVWQGDYPVQYREKAFKLWFTMYQRMMHITPIVAKQMQPKAPVNYQSGGIPVYPNYKN